MRSTQLKERLFPVRRVVAAAAVAVAAGGLVLTAAPTPIRLLGVSTQANGRMAALLIEATEPVAYAVSRPDALTVLVDLRNVSVAEAANQVVKSGPIEAVRLEQRTAIDGKSLARVHVALASPAAYKVRSARNTIRLELESSTDATSESGTPAALRLTSAHALPDSGGTAALEPATTIEHVRASNTSGATTITLSGNGRLDPSALSESDDLPRQLFLDFPNVRPAAQPQIPVDSAFVKHVRVAVSRGEPLVTRVAMELSSNATYHVERNGPDGRDIAVIFEGRKSSGAVLVAPPAVRDDPRDAEPDIPMPVAIANAAAITPADPAEPFTALNQSVPQRSASVTPKTVPASVRQTTAQPGSSRQTTQKPQPPSPPPPPTPEAPAEPPTTAQPTLNTQLPGTGEKKYTGNPISMDFQDADLRSVLRTFAEISGLNMVIDPQVQGRVDMVLNEVPWDQALDTILRGNKLGWTVDGTIVRIAPLSVLADEQADQRKLTEAKALAGELRVQTFTLSYAKAGDLSQLLTKSALSQRGQIQVDSRTNTLIITDLPDRLQTAATLIGTLDRAEPQVEVEARVVQTTRDFARAIGIQWGLNGRVNSEIGNTTPLAFPNNGSLSGRVGGAQGGADPRSTSTNDRTSTVVNLPAAAASSGIGLALGAINGAFNLDVALTALENTGKGRILSTPRLTTQNNQEAEVAQGIQIPIQVVANNTVTVSFKDAVLLLKVTPQITAANTVIMNITIENATPDFSRQVNGVPPIDTQRAITRVQVNDGATTVIGGIFVSQEQSTNDRTPVLHRIPLLGWLFKRDTLTDSSRELLIFITPRILRG